MNADWLGRLSARSRGLLDDALTALEVVDGEWLTVADVGDALGVEEGSQPWLKSLLIDAADDPALPVERRRGRCGWWGTPSVFRFTDGSVDPEHDPGCETAEMVQAAAARRKPPPPKPRRPRAPHDGAIMATLADGPIDAPTLSSACQVQQRTVYRRLHALEHAGRVTRDDSTSPTRWRLVAIEGANEWGG